MVHSFDMAGYGLAHWITFAVMALVLLYPIGRILTRIGFSPFWAVLVFVPIFNLIGLWLLAFVAWPSKGSRSSG
ncbi:hypothetical protein [Ralstonia solanacearum]|uniref:hypothetical protein n=1 Tax=Ralstonia solanacearum TaxID=305 RepID=UPI0005AC483F|nr:hypothetical protein [Ralstonia solanacearum]MDC6177084.1 hypothetical protein [Ralstonia solanacearum]MDC6238384.1 hypothetical protein [Ralstonia solanacearum]